MPVEIIARIFHWLPQETIYRYRRTDPEITRLRRKFQERDSPDLWRIRRIALVNRALYMLCCPYLYKEFDSEIRTMDTVVKWKFAFEEILKRHSYHLRKIRCRFSKADLQKAQRTWDDDELDDSEWKQEFKARSEVLLNFLQSCPNLMDLDIDLDPTLSLPTTHGSETSSSVNHSGASLSSEHNQSSSLYVRVISQLTSLTHLSLSSPLTSCYHSESFIVDMISNLSQLQSFTCSKIDATRPKPLGDRKDEKVHKSPLGTHLASLAHLMALDLEEVRCLDFSWNEHDWKSRLKVLALAHCDRVSVPVLHGFIQKFKSTLITLSLDDVPVQHYGIQNRDSIRQDLSTQRYQFKCRRLTNLQVTSPSHMEILRAFRFCKRISLISLGDTPKYQEAKQLIQDRFWPRLRKFQITDQEDCLYPAFSEALSELCEQCNVELQFDDGSDDGFMDIEESQIEEWGMAEGLEYDEIEIQSVAIARFLRRSQ